MLTLLKSKPNLKIKPMKDRSFVTKEEFMKATESKYFNLPNHIFIENKLGLKDKELYVLLYLLSFRNSKTNVCHTNIRNIVNVMYGSYTDSRRNKINAVISSLKNKGLIKSKVWHYYNERLGKHTPVSTYTIIYKNISGPSWEKIPKSLVVSEKYDWKEKLFIVQLYHFVHSSSNKIYYTRSKIATLLNLSYTKVSNYINSLINKEAIFENKGIFEIDFFKFFDLQDKEVLEFIEKINGFRKENGGKSVQLPKFKQVLMALQSKIDELENLFVSSDLSPKDVERYNAIIDKYEIEFEELGVGRNAKDFII